MLRARIFVLCCALSGAVAQSPAPAPILADRPAHGVQGKVAGTERWVVHFAKRSFELAGFRAAILARRPAAEVDAIVADLERQVRADQTEFVTAVEALGGAVVTQWWIVNAAAIEIAPAQLEAVRLLPGVAFVQPDEERLPAIKTATNSSNHRADALQAQGFVGLGVTVGVVDTGQDENVGGTGRPHRAYFVNGDPANPTGGGIGGSRLLINRQIGLVPPDDPHGHGTGVASICAGANWGTPGADDGHAPMAGIAGYSLSDSSSGGTTLATMATAWQQLAADRATYTIVAANMSYSASPDPLDVSSQAIDSVALNADVMCCVAAANTGASTVVSCSCANGLAVGALNANVHTVAGFSSRGPLLGDPTRTYPDIAACGVSTVMALRDNEAGDYTESGTSMASPQVTGASAQLRARFPALTAPETKAVLLASAVDLTVQNPGLGRNDFGVGMLRNDRAHLLAGSGQFGSGTLTAAAPQQTFTIPVQAGQSYRVAIAWYRQVLGSMAWSDLDLAVLDAGGGVIAQSTSPRNLYEVVEVYSPLSGNLTVRITGTQITNPTEPFSWAWMDAPPVPVFGTITMYGSACAPIGAELNPAAGTLVPLTTPNELAYRLVAPTNLTVNGLDVFCQTTTGSPATVVVGLYSDVGGAPSPSFLRVSAVSIGGAPGWYHANFASAATIPAGPFWIALDHRLLSTNVSNVAVGATSPCFQRPTLLSGVWSPSPLVVRPAFRVSTASPTTGGQPSLAVTGTPTIGLTSTFALSQGPQNGVMLLGLGFSDTTSPLGALPFPLEPLGAPGCTLLMSSDILQVLLADASGAASWPLAIPNLPTLVTARIFAQGIVLAPTANALELTFSRGANVFIGN